MTITLTASGAREVVDEGKATSMIDSWREELKAHREANPSAAGSVLCNKIVLTNKSITSGAAKLIQSFLTSTEEFEPSIASGISSADLSDIIASRMEEEGLEVLKTISESFAESQLLELDLSDNAMGSKGVTACESILGASTLEKLSLCNNGLSEYTMSEVADLLTKDQDGCSCIAQNLTQIHFYNNMSGPNGCSAFARIMEKCTDKKLTDIRFSSTRASTQGSARIAVALHSLAKDGNLENLVRLDLKDNTFSGEDSYTDLAGALKCCSKLKYLNLGDCMLGDEGTKLVCAALASSSAKLTYLNVSGNEITAKGAKSVAKLIKNINATLEDLQAEENEMTSAGIKRIIDAIDSPTLKTIILNQNECGNSGGLAIVDMAEQGRAENLVNIELDLNMFQDHVVEKLTETFGDKLAEMEDNDDEDDVDEDLEEEEDTDDGGEEEEDANVDALAGALQQISM